MGDIRQNIGRLNNPQIEQLTRTVIGDVRHVLDAFEALVDAGAVTLPPGDGERRVTVKDIRVNALVHLLARELYECCGDPEHLDSTTMLLAILWRAEQTRAYAAVMRARGLPIGLSTV